MKIFNSQIELNQTLKHLRSYKSIGFVPTMGALHTGHISLVQRAKEENDLVVVSIFVNPTQFDNQDDLTNYPSTIEEDEAALREIGADFLYLPSVEDIYPNGLDSKHNYSFNGLDQRLEGKMRPGHFDGVVKVVSTFLKIVLPDSIYMGQKDYQQYLMIDALVNQMPELDTAVVMCPIAREENGLAMSSRNKHLSVEEKREAKIIFESLEFVKKHLHQDTFVGLREGAIKLLSSSNFIQEIEYFELLDSNTLEVLKDGDSKENVVACVAVQSNKVRLIDNMLLFS